MDPANFLGFLRLKPVLVFAVVIASSLFLFLPGQTAHSLGISSIRDFARPAIGVLWLLSASLLTAHALAAVTAAAAKEWRERRMVRAGQRRLHQLTPQEQQVLAGYLRTNSRTRSFPFTDGVIAELVAVGILRRATNVSQIGQVFPYNLQPWAWYYLKRHPELVGSAREHEPDLD